MRIHLAVLSTLALASCPSTWNCKPDSDEVDLDQALTLADVEQILADYGLEAPGEIDCSRACSYVVYRDTGWQMGAEESCTLDVDADLVADETTTATTTVGNVQCKGTSFEYLCEGRRPLDYIEPTEPPRGPGATLAHLAHLEAASVLAFHQLAEQLERWKAPARLVAHCQKAAADEMRHARLLTAFAKASGATIPKVTLRAGEDRGMLEAALHNAVEGCVNETWAAVLASLKAGHAHSAPLRAAYASIATDEADHAQLAWDLHAWFATQLNPDEVAAIDEARRKALHGLTALARDQQRELPRVFGLGSDLPELAAHFSRQLAA